MRMRMFGALVESVGLYGAEVWGWRRDERLHGLGRKYAKWVLGVERVTPNFIVDQDCGLESLADKALERTIRYEEATKKKERNW
ncbi:hypothetical protein KPH14_012017 [Odynerus spinipes]|uniref:Uncharacterized protein n=1 Tax=Odynerus spinipes TaxID=1348599 RepID=A0AAD9RFR6_9HYME|nr:hypothetical protein KPH14_012017 [Odynerus spinipes]